MPKLEQEPTEDNIPKIGQDIFSYAHGHLIISHIETEDELTIYWAYDSDGEEYELTINDFE